MSTPAASSLFMSLGNAWRLLTLRSDVDDIILELLGRFSLDKIYAESDKEAYQHLLTTLICQLHAVLFFQRLTLPSENQQVGSIGWYLGFLVSWEVILRSLEFVLQVVQEGRESLWEAESLRDFYLPDFILSALRLLTLHPKAPTNQRAKERREQFARIDRSLERIYDSYPGSKSFLFLVSREITSSLRNEPNALALPAKMRYELPNLAADLYPLPECLSSQYVSTIVPQSGFASRDWLAQFLALRDVSHFLVGASVQFAVNRETRDVRLQSSSARTRNAVLHAIENLGVPEHLAHFDLRESFSETFRIILPDTPGLDRYDSAGSLSHETKMDAIDAFCSRLSDRLVIHRVSDRELMHSLSEISRSIALLDDPGKLSRPARPKLYAMNCPQAHLAGDSQLRSSGNLKFPEDPADDSEIKLPPDSLCMFCGEPITMMREVSLARQTWDTLKPLEPNPDTINVERHLRTQFQLVPPKFDTSMAHNPSFGSSHIGGDQQPSEQGLYSPYPTTSTILTPLLREQHRSISQTLISPVSPVSPLSPLFSQGTNIHQRFDAYRMDAFLADNATANSSDGTTHSHSDGQKTSETQTVPTSIGETPISPIVSLTPTASFSPKLPRITQSPSSVTFDNLSLLKSRTLPSISPPEKPKSGWRSKLTRSRKETGVASTEPHSHSPTSLEAQHLEEISLTSLISVPKSLAKSKTARTIRDVNVHLSQNSTHALFWSQTFIHILDVGTSPATVIHALATDSTCVLAAMTKVHLAYIIKSQDQRLTLRIANLVHTHVPVVEYRMPLSPYCTSLSISPKENVVAVGFESPIVRLFRTTKSEPREDRLHSRYHDECKEKECSPIGTLSFSNDGVTLLASTRSLKNGTISIYSWRYPFETFQEESKCRYHVPMHQSEDNGVTSAIFRPGTETDPNLICITTWTLSGVPVLIHPDDGQKSDIKTDRSGHQGQLGSRVQCAAFSPSGKELAMVNGKGHIYQIVGVNSNPQDVRRIATSIELTKKEDFFAMTYMTLFEEEAIVVAWADSNKAMGYVKKIPIRSTGDSFGAFNYGLPHPEAPAPIHYELSGDGVLLPKPPVEMNAPDAEVPPYMEKAREDYQ